MQKACWRSMGLLLFVLLLAGCGNTGQLTVRISTPTPTATSIDPGQSFSIPAQVAPSPSPTPQATAMPKVQPTSPPRTTGGGASGQTSSERQLQLQLFNLINQDRAAQGLYPYVLNSTLSTGARAHSLIMSGSCGMSHQCPGESDPCQRVSDEGISWTSCGENVGYTSPNPTSWAGVQKIDQSMLNEQPPDDGHRRNLLSTSFHRVGVGICIDGRGYVWVTEDFAS